MRAHGDTDVTHLLLHSRILPKKGFPVLFHGIKGKEKRTTRSPSYFNINEASVVRNYCVMLTEDTELKLCKSSALFGIVVVFLNFGVDPEEIGVIAPYRAQVRTIRELLKQANLSEISVGSVEQFQGQVSVKHISYFYDGWRLTLACFELGTKGDYHGNHS